MSNHVSNHVSSHKIIHKNIDNLIIFDRIHNELKMTTEDANIALDYIEETLIDKIPATEEKKQQILSVMDQKLKERSWYGSYYNNTNSVYNQLYSLKFSYALIWQRTQNTDELLIDFLENKVKEVRKTISAYNKTYEDIEKHIEALLNMSDENIEELRSSRLILEQYDHQTCIIVSQVKDIMCSISAYYQSYVHYILDEEPIDETKYHVYYTAVDLSYVESTEDTTGCLCLNNEQENIVVEIKKFMMFDHNTLSVFIDHLMKNQSIAMKAGAKYDKLTLNC